MTADAEIVIPGLEGQARVDQLLQHLDIQRMSKSKGNVANPDELVYEYGADTVRAYLMFAFDFEKGGPWIPEGIKGVQRWLADVWDLVTGKPPRGAGQAEAEARMERRCQQTIARVSDGLQDFRFNTAIAELMALRNDLLAARRADKLSEATWFSALRTHVLLMAPFTPHIAEECWAKLGGEYSIHQQSWPDFDESLAQEPMLTLVVQGGRRVVDRLEVPASISEEQAKALALASDGARKLLGEQEPPPRDLHRRPPQSGYRQRPGGEHRRLNTAYRLSTVHHRSAAHHQGAAQPGSRARKARKSGISRCARSSARDRPPAFFPRGPWLRFRGQFRESHPTTSHWPPKLQRIPPAVDGSWS